MSGALVQWLKLPAWKDGDRGFKPHSAPYVSKKLNVIPRSLKKIQYCGEPLDIRQPVFEFRILCLEGKCHLIHLTILVRFPWSALAHMWPIGGLKPLIFPLLGGGPRVVVSTAAFHAFHVFGVRFPVLAV